MQYVYKFFQILRAVFMR